MKLDTIYYGLKTFRAVADWAYLLGFKLGKRNARRSR